VSSELETKQRIVRGQVDFPDIVWHSLPAGASCVSVVELRLRGLRDIDKLVARSLVTGLLRYNYEARYTVAMALETSWIYCDLEDLDKAFQERVFCT
jgi:hypothetical protein